MRKGNTCFAKETPFPQGKRLTGETIASIYCDPLFTYRGITEQIGDVDGVTGIDAASGGDAGKDRIGTVAMVRLAIQRIITTGRIEDVA